MMISALKITAERMALSGVLSAMMFRERSSGYATANIAGRIAKYLATSFAIEKVVIAPRVMRSCLPIAMTSMSFVGSESRSTMLAASLQADVPLFMASPTSACATAGASFVPSPVIATRWPSACSARIRAILSSGLACAMKSSTPASSAIVRAVNGLSPVTMIVRMPIRRSSSKRARRPGLTVSLSSITPSTVPFRRIASGVAPRPAISSLRAFSSGGAAASRAASIASTAPLRTTVPSARITPLVRDCAEKGTTCATAWPAGTDPASAVPASAASRVRASSTIERPSGVSSSTEVRRAASTASRSSTPGRGTIRDASRLPKVIVPVLSRRRTSTSPAASTARPLIARTLNRATRSMPAMPIAERRPPIVVGIRQTSSATRTTSPSWALA